MEKEEKRESESERSEEDSLPDVNSSNSPQYHQTSSLCRTVWCPCSRQSSPYQDSKNMRWSDERGERERKRNM